MTTTMYLNNNREIAAATRAAKELGYQTSQADIRANDRYVMNIVARLAGADQAAAQKLESAIKLAVFNSGSMHPDTIQAGIDNMYEAY